MPPTFKSAEFRLQAEEAELLARSVSYLPDKDRFRERARYWREQERKALLSEAR